MNFLVVTLAPTLKKDDGLFHSYAPYVKEMNLWFSKVDKVTILSPNSYDKPLLTAPFSRQDIRVVPVPNLVFKGVLKSFKSMLSLPVILLKVIIEMRKAYHIHLRCPSNMGLIAAFVQILFPIKTKSVKYAGNWDPNAKQPWSYRLQKRLLSNTFWSKNLKILVYGDWPHQTNNVLSFFTASYYQNKTILARTRSFGTSLKAMFVGTLSPGKQPLYALEICRQLRIKGIDITLDVYGDGSERSRIEDFLEKENLTEYVNLYGNTDANVVEEAYRNSQLLLLPSLSEGWPKVVAEAMFWGCIPVCSKISCVPWMLDNGKRGVLLNGEIEKDVLFLFNVINNDSVMEEMSSKGQIWSQQYTLNKFESEIAKLL